MIIEKGYKTCSGYHCLIGCIENYLKYYEIPLTGIDLFFGGRGYEIEYEISENGSFRLEAAWNFLEVLGKSGIRCKKVKVNKTGESLKKHMIDLIDEEKALIVKVDSRHIRYDNVFSRRKSVGHFFNLIGYNLNEDKFCISDSFIPAYVPSCKQIWIDTAEFLEMWKSRKEMIILDVCCYNPSFEFDTRYAVIEQLKTYLEGKIGNNIFYGKFAIRRLLNDLEKMIIKSYAVELVTEMHFQLRVRGFFMAREYLCIFLKCTNSEKMAEKVSVVIERWKILCASLAKYVMVKNQEKLKRAFAEANELCDLEEKLLEQIVQTI